MNTENEILAALRRQARKPSRNAATLTHNIGATFPFLETQWDDQARQIIGALVAVNASRMHSTIWAALFQQLREASVPSIKVYILKQFANVCWTVPLSQGANAFRAFALEIRPLLSDIQIVTNTAFQRHFSSIVCHLTHFADEALSLELYNTLYANLVEWKRVDALRAASNVIAELVLRIPHCPTVEALLSRAKEDMDLFPYSILLDTAVAAETSDSHSQNRERIPFFCQEVARVLSSILTSTAENAKSIPPWISAYRRIKSMCKSWEPANADAFVTLILEGLESDSTSKLLICPYLQFLQTTALEWSSSSDAVWKQAESSDPFVRADAFLALSTKSLTFDASEKRLTIAELLDKLHAFIGEGCSYTVVAILKYMRVLLLTPDIPPPTQHLYLMRLLHICSRHGKDFRDDAAAQVELLSLFAAAPTVPDAVQNYAVRVFLVSSDRVVATKAFEVLLRISVSCKLDEETRAFPAFHTTENNFDSFVCADRANNSVESTCATLSVQCGETLATLIRERMLQWPVNEASDTASKVIACDAVRRLCEWAELESNTVAVSHHATLTLLSQLLISQEEVSSDVYVSLIQAAAACVRSRDSRTSSDVSLFARLVQHTWSVLVDCATLLHPDYAPPAEAATQRFFRTDATPFHLHNLIVKCRDVALSNEVALRSSAFYDLVESNVLLLIECVHGLAFSPLFLCEAVSTVEDILKCCDTLFLCVPKQALSFITVLFDVLVSFEAASGETDREIKRFALSFSNCCTSFVSRPITLDFQSYCPDLCNFLRFCLQEDQEASSGIFSELIASNWTFIADLATFCESECICYGNSDDGSTVLSVLKLLRCISWSSYRGNLGDVIFAGKIENIAAISKKWRWFAEKDECYHLLMDLQCTYAQTSLCVAEKLSCEQDEADSPSSFFEDLERVVDLWSVSDAAAQHAIREHLLRENTGRTLSILAAVDNAYIPTAISFVLSKRVEECVLELLLLVLGESSRDDLPPLEFYVDSTIFCATDHLVKEIIQSYRWGWISGSKTNRFVLQPFGESPQTDLSIFLHSFLPCAPNEGDKKGSGAFSRRNTESESLSSSHHLLSSSPFTRVTSFSYDNFSFFSSAEEILLSHSRSALQLLNQAFVKQDNFTDLSDPHVVFLFARFISAAPSADLFVWDLQEWIALLRSWVSVSLTTQPETEQWAWLHLSCWTLFYRVFNHLFSMAKTGHPSYPKENGGSLFEEMRHIYIQLSNAFLCCDAKSVDEVAVFLIRYALKNELFFEIGGVVEEIFWCIARTCVEAVWLVVRGEQCAPLLDPEVVKFMCRIQARLGLPLHIQRGAHTLFSGHLRKYGDLKSDVEADTQRHILWLTGAFGSRLYLLAADARSSENRRAAAASLATELNDHAVFRSAALTDLFRVANDTLTTLTHAAPSAVLDALELLRDILHWTAISAVSPTSGGAPVDVEQAFEIVRGFISACSPLSREAPSQPATHCLRSLLHVFPLPRRAVAFTDEYALSVTATILTAALTSWLRRATLLSAPPAYIPCTLAIFLPYLLRLDLPLYLTALGCVGSLAAFTGSAEVEAVYQVVLPRLTEDLVDVRWDTQVSAGWTQALLAVLGSIHASVREGKEQFARRAWEGMWRGASSSEVCRSQALRERVHLSLRHLIQDLVPKSAQWEVSRLVVLSTSAPRLEPEGMASGELDEKGCDVQLPLRLVMRLERRRWLSLLVETQAEFALHAARGLDADGSRSLLFEFEKAVESLLNSVEGGTASAEEESQQCRLLRDHVTTALLSPTDAVLTALNRFDFSDWGRRRAVLRQLCTMVAVATRGNPESGATSTPWTDVYFDVLIERATCIDEGLWASCALAAVEASGGHVEWAIPALQSLVAASSTRRKRGFLRRVGQIAKQQGTQGQVRAFFAGASDRLAASPATAAVWKSELLAEVTFFFSASP